MMEVPQKADLWVPPAIIRPATDIAMPLIGTFAAAGVRSLQKEKDRGFLPSYVPDIELWLRADVGVLMDGSNFVSSWGDLSGNGRAAAEATNKPLWAANSVNGQPAIIFDGLNDKLVTPGFTVNAPFTCVAVFKNIAVTNDRRVVSFNTTVGASINQRTGPNIRLQGNSNDGPSVSTDTSAFHRYFCTWDGTSSVIAIDNGADQTSGSNISQNLALVELGTSSALGTYSNIAIGEVIIYRGVISETNRTNLATYLQSRYGLA